MKKTATILSFFMVFSSSFSFAQNLPKISKEQALGIAEKVCIEKDWSFEEVKIEERKTVWAVLTHKHHLGGNASIFIDKNTGKVVHESYSPR